MSPKSLLKHPRAASSLSDLSDGVFQPLLDDPRDPARKSGVTRVILCSGKVYVDLRYGLRVPFDERTEFTDAENIAVVRIEQINPFPAVEYEAMLATYPNLREIIWVQEEPKNMGAWTFVQPFLIDRLPSGVALRYIGRPALSSPSEGSMLQHTIEQNHIIDDAFRVAPTAVVGVAEASSNGNGAGGSSVLKNGTNGSGHHVPTTEEINDIQRTEKSSHAR